MRRWLSWHLIAVDPKLAALKPAAYFIERVLWALRPGREDPDGDFDTFSQQSLHQIFSIIAYLASNNMLRQDQMRRFLEWVLRSGLENQLSFIMHASSTSLRACMEAVLEEVMELWKTFPSGVQHILNLFISVDNLDLLNRLGGKLLHSAARNSNLDAAKLLAAYGADVNFVRPLSRAPSKLGTPLCEAILCDAIMCANIPMVQYLIGAGSDINKQCGAMSSQEVETALTIAIGHGSFNAAKILLDSGAEVNMDLKIEGHNVLEFTKAKLPKIYPMLLERLGPDHTPQVYQMIDAAEKGNRALSRFLLKYNIVQEEILEHALCHAIRMQNVGAVRTLLHRGIDPDARRSRLVHNATTGPNVLEDNLPIFLAAACSDEAISDDLMYLLWKAGANLNDDVLTRMCRLAAVEDQPERLYVLADLGLNPALLGPSVLEYIAPDGSIYTSSYFLDKGTPINLYRLRGLNSLQAAAKNGQLLLTQYLLDRGADINLLPRDDRGLTALQAATLGGFAEIIEYLIDAGADVKAPPAKKGGVTVLEAAAGAASGYHDCWEDPGSDQERKLVSIFKNLLALGAPVNRTDGSSSNVLHQLIRSSRNECLKLAIQAGAHIEAREAFQGMMTPLQVAAEANIEAIQLLLDHGAEINAPPEDEFGRTALQAATSVQNPDRRKVEFLLSRGADVNAGPARKGGVTALQGAAISGDIPITRMLLNYGADVNAAPALEEGRTAVEGAAEHGRLYMVRLLLSLGAKADPVVRFSRAIKLAEENRHFALADLLREHKNVSHLLLAEPDSSLIGLSTQTLPPQGMAFPGAGF